ncbi:hypothetical protein LNA02_04060 [Levilactobacillus namurensis]|nr:GNAT family N-acetyltransferase [Levilactobacillus namurensis]GEO73708.1 hypothetical protein LNA02_04060 [Levilactobacillus namurensis]
MTIEIRAMAANEQRVVQKISRAAFKGGESWFIGLPHQAIVLLVDQVIVGAVVYKDWGPDQRRNVYVDQFLIAPSCSGQGLGKRLLNGALTYFRRTGAQTVTAAIKTDNVGSWKNFLANGFRRTSWGRAVTYLGVSGALRQLSQSPLAFESGMELYLLDFSERPVSIELLPAGGRFLISNLLLQLPMWIFLTGQSHFWSAVAAYLGVLALIIGSRWGVGRRLEPEGHLRFNNGGGITTFLLSLIQVPFPLNVAWVPTHYRQTAEFRRHLALPELVKWAGLALLAPLAVLPNVGWSFLGHFASVLMVLQLFPVFPFEAFGGRRLYDANRRWWAITSVVTVVELGILWWG